MNFLEARSVKVPFTFYDFFGYLLPGISLGALVLLSADIPKAFELLDLKLKGDALLPRHTFVLYDFIEVLRLSPVFVAVAALLLSYILGHIIAAFSGFALERIMVERWLGYPADNLFFGRAIEVKWRTGFLRTSANRVLDKLCFPKYRRRYSEDFSTKFAVKFQETFDLRFENGADIFWTTFQFVAYNCPAAFQRSMHFLNLYAFSRNLSMTFIMASGVLVYLSVAEGFQIDWRFVALYLFISLSLFWNYLKLMRRLNDEIFRGFYAYITTVKERTEKSYDLD